MSDAASPADDPASDLERAGIVIYGKPGCCLCDDAKPLVAALGSESNLPVHVVNILDDPLLYAAYRYRIPVVRHAGSLLDEGRVSATTIRARLAGLRASMPVAMRHGPVH